MAEKKYRYSGSLKKYSFFLNKELQSLQDMTFPTAYNAVNSQEWER